MIDETIREYNRRADVQSIFQLALDSAKTRLPRGCLRFTVEGGCSWDNMWRECQESMATEYPLWPANPLHLFLLSFWTHHFPSSNSLLPHSSGRFPHRTSSPRLHLPNLPLLYYNSLSMRVYTLPFGLNFLRNKNNLQQNFNRINILMHILINIYFFFNFMQK